MPMPLRLYRSIYLIYSYEFVAYGIIVIASSYIFALAYVAPILSG